MLTYTSIFVAGAVLRSAQQELVNPLNLKVNVDNPFNLKLNFTPRENEPRIELSVTHGEDWRLEKWTPKGAGPVLSKDTQMLGRGAFGQVFQVECDGHPVVVKEQSYGLAIDQRSPDFYRRFLLRAKSEETLVRMFGAKSPYFVNIYDSSLLDSDDDTGLVNVAIHQMVMEAADGDLAPLGVRAEKLVKFAQLLLFMDEALEGLSIVHDARVAHRDVKPQNVLYVRDSKALMDAGWYATLADFGIACAEVPIEGVKKCKDVILAGTTPKYLAPEVMVADVTETRPPSLLPADVWAMGLVFFELTFHTMPRALRGLNYGFNNPMNLWYDQVERVAGFPNFETGEVESKPTFGYLSDAVPTSIADQVADDEGGHGKEAGVRQFSGRELPEGVGEKLADIIRGMLAQDPARRLSSAQARDRVRSVRREICEDCDESEPDCRLLCSRLHSVSMPPMRARPSCWSKKAPLEVDRGKPSRPTFDFDSLAEVAATPGDGGFAAVDGMVITVEAGKGGAAGAKAIPTETSLEAEAVLSLFRACADPGACSSAAREAADACVSDLKDLPTVWRAGRRVDTCRGARYSCNFCRFLLDASASSKEWEFVRVNQRYSPAEVDASVSTELLSGMWGDLDFQVRYL